MFKMGWLITKDFKTTTVLYYAFFLPGVVLHEISLWLAASILNVRADRSIKWPEPQEVAQLRLEFVKPVKNAGRLKTALMNLLPLLVGIGVIWLAASTILDVPGTLSQARTGQLTDVTSSLNHLTSAPDFWLWVYVLFTVANTMMPDFKTLRGWWPVIGAIVVLSTILFLVGLGDDTVLKLLTGPVATALNLVAGTFAITIAIDLVVVAVLGSLETIIERITGDSATFKNGKLIAITRKERIQQEAQQRASARVARKKAAAAVVPSGPPSIYNLPLPIPEPPGKDSSTTLPASPVIPSLSEGTPKDDRGGPALIPGVLSEKAPSLPIPSPPGAPRPQSPLPVAEQRAPLPSPPRPVANSQPSTSESAGFGSTAPSSRPPTSSSSSGMQLSRPASPSPTVNKPAFSLSDDDDELEASLMEDEELDEFDDDLEDK